MAVSSPSQVAIAAPSDHAARAGGEIAALGGSSVDAAIGATLVAMATEPGVCAIGGGGYITVWSAGQVPVTIDAYMEMPGRGLAPEDFGKGYDEVSFRYGGDLTTQVGHGSVATPGALAGLALASERFGSVPWSTLFEPVIEITAKGFPLGKASWTYLTSSGVPIFARDDTGRAALFDGDELRPMGAPIIVDGLSGALASIAEEGVDLFYHGEIAESLATDMANNGGIITRRDLAEYKPIVRAPLVDKFVDWVVATNPGPAIGGATLVAMLTLLHEYRHDGWSAEAVRDIVRAQHGVLGFRTAYLDEAEDRIPEVARLLTVATEGDWRKLLTSPSTIHVSATDANGNGCAITMSAGYGSGNTIPGTGIWLNNSLGEIELNRHGFHQLPIGDRLISNMAPTVARREDGAVLAVGSPGADRITTAILATLLNVSHHGMDLYSAIEAPRLHVEIASEPVTVAYEDGLPMQLVDLPTRRFPEPHMFFGGASAAMTGADGSLSAAADPRRTGGVFVT